MSELPTHTQAAVLEQIGQPLRLRRLELPPLKPGQALVELAYSGVCHSQLLEVRGKRGPDRFLPHTLGHEGSGTVLAVGPGVAKVKPADPVVLSWIKGNGVDVPSTLYPSADGPVNSGAISTFMRYTVTCENRLTPIPKAMPLREAALLGCAVPTGAGVVLNAAKLPPNSSLAVFGAGGIGLSAILAAAFAEANPIVAVDVRDHKLQQARMAGATHLVHARHQDPLTVIRELTGGRGVECAIEAAGRPETMELAFRSVRDAGGLCLLAGNLAHGERITLDPFDLIRGKLIRGTWGGETQPDNDLPRYCNLYLSGRLRLDRIPIHAYRLDQIDQALDDLDQGKLGRALIALDETSHPKSSPPNTPNA
ncbi:MAG: zinc-binding dehydrogenase [Verrucomicrobia bacterium]|nr:zinc-binding dehydrogenase [Verrucomicrobiota bacterium]